ncbi:hypothetical protein HQP42_03900 [Rhodococcus fascians]|nr:hypothetical protein [Rhodococcus fascians]MBY3824220.1 hypothetical protein [Rhodococcus fascians]MBY3834742.1 hypothetical protein [Rhodococcus fascians]MBY3863954.1 hypothetical protein [Rhodococcus fascians]MBY3883425.1 hypothetical protein [Rhodococcus fascians]
MEWKSKLEAFHAAGDYESLIRIASIRESAFRTKIAKELGFTSFERYQKAVSLAVAENSALADRLRFEIAVDIAE